MTELILRGINPFVFLTFW